MSKYLSQFTAQKREIRRLEYELEELKERAGLIGIDYSRDHARVNHYGGAVFEDVVGDINDTTIRLAKKIRDLYKARETFLYQIKAMPDPLYSDILYYRYAVGLTWEEVSERAFTSLRNAFRVHTMALRSFGELYGYRDE